jgi:hypothetical protein
MLEHLGSQGPRLLETVYRPSDFINEAYFSGQDYTGQPKHHNFNSHCSKNHIYIYIYIYCHVPGRVAWTIATWFRIGTGFYSLRRQPGQITTTGNRLALSASWIRLVPSTRSATSSYRYDVICTTPLICSVGCHSTAVLAPSAPRAVTQPLSELLLLTLLSGLLLSRCPSSCSAGCHPTAVWAPSALSALWAVTQPLS